MLQSLGWPTDRTIPDGMLKEDDVPAGMSARKNRITLYSL